MQVEYKLKDGNRMPALGLGTWRLTGGTCRSVVKRALELGYKHIDTAEMYRNQREIGEAMRGFDRSKVFVTSKVWSSNLRYTDTLRACDRTLRELDTDYLDLYLIHWPNDRIPMEETFRAFKELIDSGRTMSVGVSNFTLNHLKEALRVAKVPVTVDQVKFSPYTHKRVLLEFCRENGVIITAYSPLGKGSLLQDRVLREIAEKYDRTAAQICLRWSLQKGCVVIPKSSSEAHLKENLNVFDWEISPQDIAKIDSLA